MQTLKYEYSDILKYITITLIKIYNKCSYGKSKYSKYQVFTYV